MTRYSSFIDDAVSNLFIIAITAGIIIIWQENLLFFLKKHN